MDAANTNNITAALTTFPMWTAAPLRLPKPFNDNKTGGAYGGASKCNFNPILSQRLKLLPI